MQHIELNRGAMSARISTLGAELVSLTKDGKEYLWQGDPAFWHGQSPLLFPTTGNCWEGQYRHDGQVYQIEKHGFARHTEFSVVNRSADSVTMGIHSTDDTLRVFPFQFFLFVTYRLSGSGIEVEWFVRNEGDPDMFFAIGAHPAFYLPDFDPADTVRGYFGFDTSEPIEYLIPTEQGCVDASSPRLLELDPEKMMPITARTFDIDTYVIEAKDISRCTLFDARRTPYLAVDFHMPVLSLWAPTLSHPDCPFVAIEPWQGSCDTVGYDGELAGRRHINRLAPAEHFRTSYKISIF